MVLDLRGVSAKKLTMRVLSTEKLYLDLERINSLKLTGRGKILLNPDDERVFLPETLEIEGVSLLPERMDFSRVKHLTLGDLPVSPEKFSSLVYIRLKSSREDLKKFSWPHPLKVLRLQTSHPIEVDLPSLEELVVETSSPILLNVAPRIVLSSGVIKRPNLEVKNPTVLYRRICVEDRPYHLGKIFIESLDSMPGKEGVLSGVLYALEEDKILVDDQIWSRDPEPHREPSGFMVTITSGCRKEQSLTLEEFSHLTNLQDRLPKRYLETNEEGQRSLSRHVGIDLCLDGEPVKCLALERLITWIPDYNRRLSWFPEGKITPSLEMLRFFVSGADEEMREMISTSEWVGFLSLTDDLRRARRFLRD